MLRVNDYWLCIGVSIWTIIQTLVHVWWILQGRKLFSCHYEIQQKIELYIYYTYLYSNDCDRSPIENFIARKQDNTVIFPIFTNTSEEIYSLELFFQRDSIVYPFYEKQTNKLMLCNIIIDALWFVSSVSLLVATIFKLKEWSAVIFLCPWIVVDVLVLILDLFGAVFFGLQIRNTQDKLVAESKIVNFESIDVPNLAVMAIVSGRLGIIWLINCILLLFVIKATWRAAKRRYADERSKHHNISAEARIKNWQQFYGVIDDGNGNSIGNITQDEHLDVERDVNYSCTFKDFKDFKGQKRSEGDNLSSTLRSSSGSLPKTTSTIGILRGQLPWSYTQNSDTFPKSLVDNKSKIMTIAPTVEEVSRF